MKTIPGYCEKSFAFPPESLFTFSPESCSPSLRNAFHVRPGIAFTFPRNPQAGFVCPVVTVQSRIAKGLFSLSEFEIWFTNFAASLQIQGAFVVGPYVCPHRFADPCPCKKPNTVLYERAAAEHQLKPADCFVIGDSPEDVRAARGLGARGCLVRTGWAIDPRVVEKATPDASVVVNSLAPKRRIGSYISNDRRRCGDQSTLRDHSGSTDCEMSLVRIADVEVIRGTCLPL